jgi:hypothetical protein
MGHPGDRRGGHPDHPDADQAPIGPYQLQAAIAAVHDEADRFEDTDWRQILGLYELLHSIAPGPMVTLNTPSPSPWSTAHTPLCSNSTRRTPTRPSPGTTECTPSAHTSSTWQATETQHAPTTN